MDQKELNALRKKMSAIDVTERFKKLIRFRVSTGIIALDIVTGGGIPSGRLTEFFGGESSSKTRLIAHIIAECQKLGGMAILNDVEKALDQGLVDLTGVDLGNMMYPDPEKIITVEDVFKSLEHTIDHVRPAFKDKPVVFIWDSVAATPTKDDLDEKKEVDRPVGPMHRAKLIGGNLNKYMPGVYKNQITLIFINQIIDKMNVMFGDTKTTPGGRKIKFLASLRLGMQNIKKVKDKDTQEQIAAVVQMKVVKSKVCPPFGIVKFEVPAFEPISKYAGLFDYMKRHGEIIKVGQSSYQFIGEEAKWMERNFETAYEEWRAKKK